MAYEFEQFKQDLRTTIKAGQSKDDIDKVRQLLTKLLANKDFVEKTCGAGAEGGLHRIYVDPDMGFEVLAHINDKSRKSPPHDHGESWAVYGQAIGYTDMTEYNRTDDGKDPDTARLEVSRKYRLNPGEVGTYSHGAIHAIDYPDKSRFIRVTGTNLDNIWRVAFDPDTGRIRKMGPQQAS